MANKKVQTKSKNNTEHSNLSYEEYYSALMLAKKIRLENDDLLKRAETSKEKIQLLESLLPNYGVSIHSSSSKEKEIATLIKINIFIPDHKQFTFDYKNYDKNIRLIAEAYQIPAPIAISKVAEIGKYDSFLKQLEENGGLEDIEIEQKKKVKNSSKKKSSKGEESKTSDITAVKSEEKKVDSVLSTDTSALSPISSQLLSHITSMQAYCERLLARNQQLDEEKNLIQNYIKEQEALIKRLRNENQTLHNQINHLSTESQSELDSLRSENQALRDQMANQSTNSQSELDSLRSENQALRNQMANQSTKSQSELDSLRSENQALRNQMASQSTKSQSELDSLRSENQALRNQMASQSTKSQSELDSLRSENQALQDQIINSSPEKQDELALWKQIRALKVDNQELASELKREADKTDEYRKRTISAEARLEQLQDTMDSIARQVDTIDLLPHSQIQSDAVKTRTS